MQVHATALSATDGFPMVQLPSQGDNFVAYSVLGVELGKTYAHGLVRQAVLDSYANV